MYKYSRTIRNGAEKFIDGIGNIEKFLDDEDNWNFHDSELHSFHWDEHTRIFSVVVIPIGCRTDIEGWDDGLMPLLEFHFSGTDEVKMDLFPPYYIEEIIITQNKGVECFIGGYGIYIHCSSITVEAPKFVPEVEDF
jgi:hypothetical protein